MQTWLRHRHLVVSIPAGIIIAEPSRTGAVATMAPQSQNQFLQLPAKRAFQKLGPGSAGLLPLFTPQEHPARYGPDGGFDRGT